MPKQKHACCGHIRHTVSSQESNVSMCKVINPQTKHLPAEGKYLLSSVLLHVLVLPVTFSSVLSSLDEQVLGSHQMCSWEEKHAVALRAQHTAVWGHTCKNIHMHCVIRKYLQFHGKCTSKKSLWICYKYCYIIQQKCCHWTQAWGWGGSLGSSPVKICHLLSVSIWIKTNYSLERKSDGRDLFLKLCRCTMSIWTSPSHIHHKCPLETLPLDCRFMSLHVFCFVFLCCSILSAQSHCRKIKKKERKKEILSLSSEIFTNNWPWHCRVLSFPASLCRLKLLRLG